MLIITPLFLAVSIPAHIWLSAQIIKRRRTHGVRLGDDGHEHLKEAIRAQGNFSEYVPMFVLAMLVLELQSVSLWVLAPLALLMATGRGLHAYSLLKFEAAHPDAGMGRFKFRIPGMICTFTALGLSALTLLVSVV